MLRIYEFFIGTIVNHDKNDYFDKRHILVCDNCYWCLSYLPDLENDDIEYFNDCPKCNAEVKMMYISENASKDVDFRHRENILAQSENWII